LHASRASGKFTTNLHTVTLSEHPMKKLILLAVALPVAVLASAGANCAGATKCTSDADCATAKNSAGEDTPYCDTGASVCVPNQGECTEDWECQLINPDAPTTVEDCSSDGDCGADEHCIETAGSTVCAVDAGGAGGCGSDVSITTDSISGSSVDVCASANGTCGDNGGCTY
jgi:hypothetical protein